MVVAVGVGTSRMAAGGVGVTVGNKRVAGAGVVTSAFVSDALVDSGGVAETIGVAVTLSDAVMSGVIAGAAVTATAAWLNSGPTRAI
jgi:hypothetical protein